MSSNSSLRSRLTRSLLIGTGLILLVTGLVLSHFVEGWLVSEFDRGLEDKARALVSLTEQDAGVVELDYVEELMPEFSRDDEPEYFELWVDEEPFSRSPSVGDGRDLPRDTVREARLRIRDVELLDGTPGRQVQVEFVPLIDDDPEEEDVEECRELGYVPLAFAAGDGPAVPEVGEAAEDAEPLGGADEGGDAVDGGEEPDDDPEDDEESDEDEEDDEERALGEDLDPTRIGAGYRVGSLVVARSREDLDERILFFRTALGGVALLLLGMITLLVHGAVRSGLAPVERVAAQVEALDADQLAERIEGAPPAELDPLVRKLNELLDRLEGAFERERRFSSDVAHELRTPIAELRSLSDVGGRWPGDRESVQEFFDDVRHISGHMDEIVAQLLALARADAGLEAAENDSVVLGEALDDIWRTLAHDANERGMVLERDVDLSLALRTDPGKLERILRNLLSNAVRYGTEGGELRIRTRRAPGGVALAISNPTPDLEPDDLPHLFDRFWRKDSVRRSGDGAGLGLALVRAFCDLLGFGVEASLEAGEERRLVFTVTFPESAVERGVDRAAVAS